MSQEIVKAGATAVAPTGPLFHGEQSFDFKDIILPVLTIRQNQYRKEDLKKFKPGDVLLRPSNQVVATEEKPAHFVLVGIEKVYRICDMTDGEAKTKKYENADVDKPFQFEEQGRLYRRDRCFIAHVLLREQLDSQAKMFERLNAGEMVDPDDFVLPTRIVFARSSLHAGKVLNTHAELSKALNSQSPAFLTFALTSTELKNDRGHWYGFDVKKAEKTLKYTPKELLPACEFWIKTLAKSKFAAHEDDDEVAVVDTVSTPVDESQARF